ncbi:hypothetical protein SAMN05421740_10724 [Parapedobacter koreensis]|uniref:Cyclic nucleotide-binding domain-containing protein n=1 Tax=Parapedobacter koreensis TaxID=332977 RepID=A0A1H7RCF8_9SPHI|nr:hypothetical protein SAMN05421740_10724 [Parapedobacter koreensis]
MLSQHKQRYLANPIRFVAAKFRISEGEHCNSCFFVLKGCLRQYRIINVIEKTIRFFTENQATVFFTSYIKPIAGRQLLVQRGRCVVTRWRTKKGCGTLWKIPQIGADNQNDAGTGFGRYIRCAFQLHHFPTGRTIPLPTAKQVRPFTRLIMRWKM